jgi:hypothetical protein
MTIRASDVRKTIKDCEIHVSISPHQYSLTDVVGATIVLSYKSDAQGGAWRKGGTYVRISLQANNVWGRDRGSTLAHDQEYRQGIKLLPGIGPFYASEIETKTRVLGYGGSEHESPGRAAVVADLIRATVERYNLNHKHPDCELSQIVEALILLGASDAPGWIVYPPGGGKLDLRTWIETREKNRPVSLAATGSER